MEIFLKFFMTFREIVRIIYNKIIFCISYVVYRMS